MAKYLEDFFQGRRLIAFDVEGVSRRRCLLTKVFDGPEWSSLKFKRLEGKRFPAVTTCKRARIWSVERGERAKWIDLEAV